MSDSADLIIVGGGAAGLTAAIFAAQTAGSGAGIVILDGARTLGAKILVAGGGRCNVTHDAVHPSDFNGSRNIVKKVLAAFSADDAVKWFASLGVELKREETGKLFPMSDSAKTVLNALLRRCAELGVTILTDHRVVSIEHSQTPVLSSTLRLRPEGRYAEEPDRTPQNPALQCTSEPAFFSFTVNHTQRSTRCRRLILATGGRSLPKTGSDGHGWELARSLGHQVTATSAALVPLVLDPSMFHAKVSGISTDVELSTFTHGKRIDCRSGSMLWTHIGISGPVVMDASRHWVIAKEAGLEPVLQCNLLHPANFESIEKWLIGLATTRSKALIATALADRLPARVAAAIIHHAGIDAMTTCGQLPRDARRALVHMLTALPLKVQQHRGWNYAEVTAGGVPLNEIDARTMESRKCPGLYLAGEILDCDGRIGGFNFQWAWATGYLCGNAER